MNDTGVLQTVLAWCVGLVGLVGSAAVLRRRLSRDRTEMVKDRTEGTFVALLLRERDAAIATASDAWQARNVNAEAIARLTAENQNQAREIQRLTTEFDSFKRLIGRLYPDTRPFLGSDYQPLQP